ncbi:hypothetical protein Tco_0596272, partial [Tanacetum coccineum]
YPIWEVIQNGNGPVSITTDTHGQIKVLPPRTAEEILARERERKSRTTLLMALPEDHLAKFHKMTDAKETWDAIKSRFGGNDESKKMQKYILKQQFEGFSISNSEGLHKSQDDGGQSQVLYGYDEKPVDKEDQVFLDELKRLKRQEQDANDAAEALRKEFAKDTEDLLLQAGATKASSTNIVNTASTPVSTAMVDFTNLETIVNVSPIPTSRINSIHPSALILGDPNSAVQTRSKVTKSFGAHAFICLMRRRQLEQNGFTEIRRMKEVLWFRNKARLVAQGHRQEEGIDYDVCKTACTPIETQMPLVKDEELSCAVLGNPQQERVSGGNHEGQSSSDRSLSGNEGGMTLQSVYDLCISLCTQVTDQAKEIKHLKAQIKKLKEESQTMDAKGGSVSKQGRKPRKVKPTVHKDPTFDELDDDTMDYMEIEDALIMVRTSYCCACKRSTDIPDEGTVGQIEGRSATQTAPTTTPTIFGDDETIAQDRLRAKFLMTPLSAQEDFLAQQRSEAIRNKPPLRNQLRNQMMTYLKHVGGKKHSDLKTKGFEEIKALYDKIKRSDDSFIAIGSAEDEKVIKEMSVLHELVADAYKIEE